MMIKMYEHFENLTIADFNQTESVFNSEEHFSLYEALGVTVLTIYFALGFPSNILLVVHFIIEKVKHQPSSMITNYHSDSRRQSPIGVEERLPLSRPKSDKEDASVYGKCRGTGVERK